MKGDVSLCDAGTSEAAAACDVAVTSCDLDCLWNGALYARTVSDVNAMRRVSSDSDFECAYPPKASLSSDLAPIVRRSRSDQSVIPMCKRVSFAQRTHCVYVIERRSYVDVVGDIRASTNWAALGLARARRLACFAENLVEDLAEECFARLRQNVRECRAAREHVQSRTPPVEVR